MNLNKTSRLLFGALLAGFAIGIAATIYLRVGGVVGAAMFAFGLIMVVAMKLPLFTGQAQHVCSRRAQEFLLLGLILLLNITGCAIASALTCTDEMMDTAAGIINSRLTAGPWRCFLLSIPCGIIMTLAVRSASIHRNWLPLLFGVPAFIICGFPHCVADSFYYASCPGGFFTGEEMNALFAYLPTVLGNYIGCNIYRLVTAMPVWFPQIADDGTLAASPSDSAPVEKAGADTSMMRGAAGSAESER